MIQSEKYFRNSKLQVLSGVTYNIKAHIMKCTPYIYAENGSCQKDVEPLKDVPKRPFEDCLESTQAIGQYVPPGSKNTLEMGKLRANRNAKILVHFPDPCVFRQTVVSIG